MMSKEGKEIVALFIVALSVFMADFSSLWIMVAVCSGLVFLKIKDDYR